MITYNSKIKTANPFTGEDVHNAITFINTLLNSASFNPFQMELDVLQKFVDNYSFLRDFYEKNEWHQIAKPYSVIANQFWTEDAEDKTGWTGSGWVTEDTILFRTL